MSCLLGIDSSVAFAQSFEGPPAGAFRLAAGDLKKLSLEELMDLEVTSVSRRPEKWLEAPAALSVLTGDDIRRSGAPDLPSALRLANSLDVARKGAHEWVISARGFSSDVGNKLLVMIDGRSVYTPLFAGVFWDRQDTVLADVDRIEIISGPGGALWGANAVNGVINIMTKSAAQTQGVYLEGGAGTDPESFASARYGGQLENGAFYRVYGTYSGRDNQAFASDIDARDAWRTAQGGFRIDQQSGRDAFTAQGDVYRNEEQIATGGEAQITGGNLLGRWSRAFSALSDLSLQVYYDRTHLILPAAAGDFFPAGVFKDDLDTLDLDFQHRFQWNDRNVLVWGLGYRFTHDTVGNAPGLAFFPTTLNQSLFSGFVQNELALRDDLGLTLGAKLEHTDYTGFEYEPNVRLQWMPAERQFLWGAVSRAVRMPSRIDRDLSQPAPGYLIVLLQGGRQFQSENLLAYELGYRGQLGARAGVSLSTFYNVYDDVRSTTVGPPDPVFGLPFPFFFENNLEGNTRGFELGVDVQPATRWRLHAGYRLLKEDLRVKPGREDFNNALNETSDPEGQFTLRSSLELPRRVELDGVLRWVDTRRMNDAGVATSVPDYFELDVRLGWHATDALEFSLAGRDLLHDRHPEYGIPGPGRIEVGRSVFGQVTWRSQ